MNQTIESLWFVFYKDELLLEKEGTVHLPFPAEKFLYPDQRQDYSTQYHHTGRKKLQNFIPYPNLLKRQSNMQ